jgi:hypothetical protein
MLVTTLKLAVKLLANSLFPCKISSNPLEQTHATLPQQELKLMGIAPRE